MSVLNNLAFYVVIFQMASGIIAAGNNVSAGLCNDLSARSCLDHFKRGWRQDGYYTIYNENDDSLDSVYCDMVPEVAAAWTLVESFAHANKNEDPFKKHPFKTNAPVDEKSANFNRYRMSQPQMTSLKSVSTHWRATCSFPVDGIDGRDQARGKFQDFDIMTYVDGGLCKPVEYVNIRGYKCSKCTARWWSTLNLYSVHLDSSSSGCDFLPTTGSVSSEDNFGFGESINPNFRCHENADSTTNWWFGAYLCDE